VIVSVFVMAGVYLSYPFCRQKCTFCNFASGVMPAPLENSYHRALFEEVSRFDWPWIPETVYWGGGTPGNLDPEVLASVMRLIPGKPWVEATIEVAPGGVAREKLRAWRAAGINRISFGVQSFAARELRASGRRHTAATVAEEIALAREEGIANFNIDLIAGLAFQTPRSLAESLDWVERLEPPHVSVYMFEIDTDSRLGNEISSGGARYGANQAPPEDLTAELYLTAVKRLEAMGIARYEISNFARPGFESRHNLKYWRLEPYAGFGSDAHSFDGSLRRRNVETAAEYVAAWQDRATALLEETPAKRDEERLFLGLRQTAGVRLSQAEWTRWSAPLARYFNEGLLARDGEVLRLTDRGVLLSNEVFQEFLAE